MDAVLGCLTCGFHGPALIVLSIGDDEYGTVDVLAARETARAEVDGSGYVGALQGNHRGTYLVEEHLAADKIAGDGQLDEGLTGKDDETYLVVGHLAHHVGYQTL